MQLGQLDEHVLEGIIAEAITIDNFKRAHKDDDQTQSVFLAWLPSSESGVSAARS